MLAVCRAGPRAGRPLRMLHGTYMLQGGKVAVGCARVALQVIAAPSTSPTSLQSERRLDA